MDSLMIFKLKPPLMLLENDLAKAKLMFIRLGLNVPKVLGSGFCGVVIGISPMLNDMNDRPKTLDSPTRTKAPNEEILVSLPTPTSQLVCVKFKSKVWQEVIPATLPNMASTPCTSDIPALPQPDEAAHGLMSNSAAPAWPERSLFPANA